MLQHSRFISDIIISPWSARTCGQETEETVRARAREGERADICEIDFFLFFHDLIIFLVRAGVVYFCFLMHALAAE